MANSPVDKEKLMAFVHGELDAKESQAIVEILKTDEQLRREVEFLKRMDTLIGTAYSNERNDDFALSSTQLDRIRESARRDGVSRGWLKGFVWGGGLVAAGAAAVVVFVMQSPTPTPINEKRMAGLESPKPMLKSAEKGVGTSARSSSYGAAAGQAAPTAELQKAKQDEGRAAMFSADSVPVPPKFQNTELVHDRTVVSSAVNEMEVVAHLEEKLSGETNCVPTEFKAEELELHGRFDSDGNLTELTTSPKDSTVVECFKSRLSPFPPAESGISGSFSAVVKVSK